MPSDTNDIETIKLELKELIIDGLSLEDTAPQDIKNDDLLFGEGLGLDSLDAVELVVLLQRKYNIEIKSMEKSKEVFYSIDTLAKFIQENIIK